MTTICSDAATKGSLAFPSNLGVSAAANEIKYRFNQEVLLPSFSIGKHYRQTLNAIAEAYEKSAVDNWDGYGAKAVDGRSCLKAIRFSELLPMFVPVPDIYVDTDGEIRFEWYRDPGHVFSVAVKSNGELIYAGIFGASITHGVEYANDELPSVIIGYIQRVYGRGIYCFSA